MRPSVLAGRPSSATRISGTRFWSANEKDPILFLERCLSGSDGKQRAKLYDVYQGHRNEGVQHCIKHRRQWLAQAGFALLEKYVAGQSLSPADERYQHLLEVLAVYYGVRAAGNSELSLDGDETAPKALLDKCVAWVKAMRGTGNQSSKDLFQ